MDPFTIAFVASQALSVASSLASGDLKKGQAKINRQVAELNAMNAEYDAFESVRLGLGKKASYEAKVDDIISKQNVILAYNDVDASFGTAKMIQEETKLMGRLNAMDIENAAYAQSLGYQRQALNYRVGGQMGEIRANAEAADSIRASIISAGSKTIAAWDKLNFGGEAKPSLDGAEVDNNYNLNYTGPQNEYTV